MEEFKQAVVRAVRHTPGGRLNRDDIRGLQRMAERLGVSESEASLIIFEAETGVKR